MVRILEYLNTHLEDCQESPKLNFLSCSSHQPRLKLCHLDKQVDPHLLHNYYQGSDDANKNACTWAGRSSLCT